MIEFRLLGKISLTNDDGAELDALLRQPKRLALLAYLASPAPGTWHRRDLLLALFWPELDTARARTSLRSALYSLRQALGEDVLRARGDEEVSIEPARMTTDLADVWMAIRENRPSDALEGYGGELLPGLFPADSEGFQRWLEDERTRLRNAVTSAGLSSLVALERDRRLSDALAVARKILEIQPDDETVVRRIMSLHDALGDRAGGLKVFESYRSRLAGDFGAEPASETIVLAGRLRSTREPAERVYTPRADVVAAAIPAREFRLEYAAPPRRSRGVTARSRSRLGAIAASVAVGVAIAALVGSPLAHSATPLAIGVSRPLTTEDGLQIEPAISPNGRLVAYAKGNGRRFHIFVQKIGGGGAWPLSGDTASVELMPRWSPDNDQLLFLSRNNAYVAPSLGAPPRLVARGANGDGMVRSAAWSPAGDSVAIVRNDSLIVQPLEGAGARLVGVGKQLHSCTWSPEGRWIACVAGNWVEFEPGPLFGNPAPSAVILFPSTGGTSIALTNSAFQYRSPAWSTDGKFLWMLSNKDGVQGEVYAVPIGRDGHAAAPFVRVGLKAEWIGISAAGRLAYSVPTRKQNIWAVPIPHDGAVTLSSATPITTGNQIIETATTSFDGKWLVYDSNIHGNPDIYRVPLIGGGAVDRMTADERPEFMGALSPDGRELAWHRWEKGERRLIVKALDSDSAQEILAGPGDQGGPRWSPVGSALAAWSHEKEEGALFVMRRDGRGKWQRTWRLVGAQLPAWSPDGRTIAFVRYDGRIETIPADSGAQATVYRPSAGRDDPQATYVTWSPDPDLIWFIGHQHTGEGIIWALTLSTGASRVLVRLDDASGRLNGPTLTADARRFYFTLDERVSNISWAELVKR